MVVPVILLDAKQLTESGAFKLGKSGPGGRIIQLSRKWLKETVEKLPEGEARAVLRKALDNETPIKTIVTAVDKKNGECANYPR